MGSISNYAWVLSLSLLLLIATLGYARVRINVKSGILPLRNYTVLDAHGSIVERLSTAFMDAFNRQSLRFAVWIHRSLSPSKPITSFDGTVVAKPGTYNTPAGMFPPTLPQATDEDEVLRQKVATKVMSAAAKGEVVLTPELLESELAKAKSMNGSYLSTPLGKTEPSPTPAATEEGDNTAAQQRLDLWKSRRDRSHYVPLDELTLDALDKPTLSDEQLQEEETESLFKQNPNLFKQTIEPQYDGNGRVIGIKYQKRVGEWDTIGYSQVKARWKIYSKRAVKKPSEANSNGLDAWDYAMQLFEEGRVELRSNLIPIHQE